MENETKTELETFARPNTERSILSICLQKPEKLIDVKGQDVKGDMFLIEANRYIYYAIEYLFGKQQEPTPITVVEVLKDRHAKQVVEEFGGIEYLTLLTEQRINENSIEILCEKLKQAYTKKNFLRYVKTVKNSCCQIKRKSLIPQKLSPV